VIEERKEGRADRGLYVKGDERGVTTWVWRFLVVVKDWV